MCKKFIFKFNVWAMPGLVCMVFLQSCTAQSTTEKAVAASPTVAAGDSIPFPIYLKFDDFESTLGRSPDTAYVVNFWATWCKPCVAELPFFEKLIGEYANRPVKITLASMDFPKDIQRKLIPFVQQRRLEAHVAALADLDYNAWIDKISPEWDGAIPFTLVYRGDRRTIKSGELASYEELAGLVEALLK